ncbi:MAG: methyltransferase domain-containing protein [Myxococcaceae bacterium]|nr:methyltransferase domain-containing protein [Myxococcaceae bacterium]
MDRQPFFRTCPICGAAGRRVLIEFPELVYVNCDGCGLLYKSEQVERLGVGYEEEYFRFNRAGFLKRWAHRVRKCTRQLRDCLVVTPAARVVLDVGCSAGYVLAAARRLGLEPVGVDISTFAVELCREKGFRAELGSLSKLPLEDASVDIATLKHTLEHVPDPLAGLRELFRVLRPGGALLVVVPDADKWKIALMPRLGRDLRPELRGWQHHVYFSSKTLALALERAGFEVAHRHKAVFRPTAPRLFEWPRFAVYWLTSWLGERLRLRRELHFVARRPLSS